MDRRRTAHILGAVLILLVFALIIFFSFIYGESIGAKTGGDKIAHLLAFMALGFACSWCFGEIPSKGFALKKNIVAFVLSFILCFLFGYGIELLQPLFGRTCDFKDLVSDIIGILLGLVVGFSSIIVTVWAFRRFIKPKLNNKV